MALFHSHATSYDKYIFTLQVFWHKAKSIDTRISTFFHTIFFRCMWNIHVTYREKRSTYFAMALSKLKPHSHCAGVATVHPDAGQPVYRDAPGHIS